MCATQHVHFQDARCPHSEVRVRRGAQCAVGLTRKAGPKERLFCWATPQGIAHVPGVCGACRWRLARYGSCDPGVSLQLVGRAARRSSVASSWSTASTLVGGEQPGDGWDDGWDSRTLDGS